jgi:N-acetylglutamate synthase-like GNAT family acetyltransferase
VISHLWDGDPPALNSLLHALPAAPTTYYIHDLALLPAARGIGAGRTIVAALRAHAGECRLATLSLVAVNRSEGFWRQLGFHTAEPDALHDKLESYGADARVMRLALAPPNGA